MEQEHIFVVIPMYRVENQVQAVIASIPAWVEGIVAVDDASPDRSAEMALAAGDPRVVLVRHEINQGVGGAMLSGYARGVELGATVMVKMDGDGQMAADFLPDIVRPILQGRADYVKGNRFVLYDALMHMPPVRRLGNLGLSFHTKLASGYWNIFDPTNGYTAITAEVFQRLNPAQIHHRYFFESSMLIELNLQRAVVADVSLPARYLNETSSLSISKTLFEFPPLLFKGLTRRIWLEYFVMDFSLGSLYLVLGNLLMAWGVLFGGIKWIQSVQSGIPATTGTVMLAAMPVILGFQLLLSVVTYDMQNVPRVPVSSSR
jgi:glycosyltransferase involved in cell wall biosynthesis